MRWIFSLVPFLLLLVFYIQKRRDNFQIILTKKNNYDGLVCLQMMLKYYKKAASQTYLENTLIDDKGTSLLQISDTATTIGLRNLAVQLPFKQFEEDAPLPAIVHFNQKFVIVYKITFDEVWVADPLIGKVQYSKKEFCKYWAVYSKNKNSEGIALLFENKK